VRQLLKILREKIGNSEDIQSTAITKNESKRIRGINVAQPIIYVYPNTPQDIKDQFPDEINGIPIAVEEREEATLANHGSCGGIGCCYNTMYGGRPVSNSASDTEEGTGGFMVTKNGSDFFVTAFHVIDQDSSCSDTRPLYHGNKKIGELSDYYVSEDFAIVKANRSGSDINVKDSVISSGDRKKRDVWAYYTESGLDYCMNNSITMHKEGITTGEASGVIDNHSDSWSNDPCVDLKGNGVSCAIHSDYADSGGPIYHKDDGSYATICTITSAIAVDDYANDSCSDGGNWYIKKYALGYPASFLEDEGYVIGSPKNEESYRRTRFVNT